METTYLITIFCLCYGDNKINLIKTMKDILRDTQYCGLKRLKEWTENQEIGIPVPLDSIPSIIAASPNAHFKIVEEETSKRNRERVEWIKKTLLEYINKLYANSYLPCELHKDNCEFIRIQGEVQEHAKGIVRTEKYGEFHCELLFDTESKGEKTYHIYSYPYQISIDIKESPCNDEDDSCPF